MRVVAVPPLYPPGSRVGAWLATHLFLRDLASRGHEVIAAPFLAPAGPSYTLEGVRVIPGAHPSAVTARADVVIAHVGGRSRDVLDGLRVRGAVVRMVHGLPVKLDRIAGAALLVANSQATADAIGQHPIPVVVCRPPTRAAEYSTTPGDRITLVNLAAAKGGDLLWAISKLAPELNFLAVRGGYGAQIEARRSNVEIVGPVQFMRDTVYARTRLLLMPSRRETWGMVGVEAMASGIPVIASPTPGLRESLGDAGCWCDSDDPAVWVAQIRALLEPEAWQAASERAMKRAWTDLEPLRELDAFAAAVENLA